MFVEKWAIPSSTSPVEPRASPQRSHVLHPNGATSRHGVALLIYSLPSLKLVFPFTVVHRNSVISDSHRDMVHSVAMKIPCPVTKCTRCGSDLLPIRGEYGVVTGTIIGSELVSPRTLCFYRGFQCSFFFGATCFIRHGATCFTRHEATCFTPKWSHELQPPKGGPERLGDSWSDW